MPLLQEQLYTTADIYALPEGTRAELIDRQIYYMAPPRYLHQRVLNKLHEIINHYIKSKNGPWFMFFQQTVWKNTAFLMW